MPHLRQGAVCKEQKLPRSLFRKTLILFLLLAIAPGPRESRAATTVSQFRTETRPQSIYLGTDSFSNGASPVATMGRLGLTSVTRTALNRWSEIETSPGVYDWSHSAKDQIVQVHRVQSEAIVPLAMAGAVPGFYPSSITNSTTRTAALNFLSAYVNQLATTGGAFVIALDPRVQETVFTALAVNPTDWAAFFVDCAATVHGTGTATKILPDVVGDNHSSFLPGTWLTTASGAADGVGIEETAPLVSTILSDVDWFSAVTAKDVWILGSYFSTWTGADARAHGTEVQQGDYFTSLLGNLILSYGAKVPAWVQVGLADAGTASTWNDHLGVTTVNLAADKNAVPRIRQYVTNFPPFHTVFQVDRTNEAAFGTPFPLSVATLADYDYLQWSGPIDLSQATAVNLTFNVTSSDGYPGYLLFVGGAWRSVPTATVDLKPWVGNGRTTFKVFVPNGRLQGTVQVSGLMVTPQVNAGLPDLYPPIVSNIEVTKRVRVDFTDTIDPVTAGTLGNYVIKNTSGVVLPVLGVALAGSKSVSLSIGQMKAITYRLYVTNVKDEAGNAMVPDTLTFTGVPPAGPSPSPIRPFDVSASPGAGGVRINLENRTAASERVSVAIYDVSGRLVRRRDLDVSPGQSGSWWWTGDTETGGRASTGVYFVRAVGRSGTSVTRLLLTR